MTARAFKQVDVFTDRALLGNPVAVVLDGDGLDDERMQAFARWTNLSETTFVLPATDPAADYRLRIFDPRSELPFAGHPTIGSAHALVEAGVTPPTSGRLVQECGAGLIALTVDDDRITFEAPEAVVTEPPHGADAASLRALVGGVDLLDPFVVDVGPRWLTARLADSARMDDLRVDLARLAVLSHDAGFTGLNLYVIDSDGAVEVRSFAPGDGVPEDPVCGSGNAAVGVHVARSGLSDRTGDRYTATQGRFVHRDGRIDVALPVTGGRVSVGGRAVTVIAGEVHL